jgi:dephospho-CoA kinase
LQKQRVLARDGMSAARFADILAKQTPDDEKRQRADFIVDSSISIADARTQVHAILAALAGKSGTAYAARMARFKAAQNDEKRGKSG